MTGSLFVESPDIMIGFDSAGSACCVWRDALSTYVLSAAHVLTGVAADTSVRWISADLSRSGSGRPIVDKLWLPMPGGELDAGLVEIVEAGPFQIGGLYPRAPELLEWNAIPLGLVVGIFGKHGRETATLVEKKPAGDFFQGHVHGRLLDFKVVDGQTDPGDSGAAVLSLPEGMLVGLHVAREIDQQGGVHSLAVVAEDVREAFRALLPGFGLRP